MTILGIETSCDETAAAIMRDRELLTNVIASQEEHLPYGGVVPELASRAHIAKIVPVVQKALTDAGITFDDLDAIGVTYGPGLIGSLLVGLTFAKGLALARRLPLFGINHLEGHLFSATIAHPELTAPFLCLVVSGGHTQLVHVHDVGHYEIIGQTRDDAAGEAFDKVAKILGLPYPGGPAIDALASEGDPEAIRFPIAELKDNPLDFSFSGLKTAVLYHYRSLSPEAQKANKAHVAASFQRAVIEALMQKTLLALAQTGVHHFALAGGVARNRLLRQEMKEQAARHDVAVYVPAAEFCTDNAAMIAQVTHFKLQRAEKPSVLALSPSPSLSLLDSMAIPD